jgi:hypothetical protein
MPKNGTGKSLASCSVKIAINSWHVQRSVQATLLNNVFHPWSSVVDTLAILTHSPNRFTRKMFIRAFTDYFNGDFQRHGISVYHAHYKMVREMVPKENLLEYRVQEGWEPLCKFLGRPVPQGKRFPNGNTGKETTSRIWALVNSECQRLLGLLWPAVGVMLIFHLFGVGRFIEVVISVITTVEI